jgi:alkylhydroperoxidase family enzyme
MVVKRGLPSAGDVSAFLAAGYSEHHVLNVILAIAVKTLSNYANHIFHTPVDGTFAGRMWVD